MHSRHLQPRSLLEIRDLPERFRRAPDSCRARKEQEGDQTRERASRYALIVCAAISVDFVDAMLFQTARFVVPVPQT